MRARIRKGHLAAWQGAVGSWSIKCRCRDGPLGGKVCPRSEQACKSSWRRVPAGGGGWHPWSGGRGVVCCHGPRTVFSTSVQELSSSEGFREETNPVSHAAGAGEVGRGGKQASGPEGCREKVGVGEGERLPRQRRRRLGGREEEKSEEKKGLMRPWGGSFGKERISAAAGRGARPRRSGVGCRVVRLW